MVDIIALAKEAGAIEGNCKIGDQFSISYGGFERFAALLEAEIVKPYKAALSIRYEPTEALVMRIEALTEQNTKLMEALEEAKKELEFHGVGNCRAVWLIDATLTPQPENKEGK